MSAPGDVRGAVLAPDALISLRPLALTLGAPGVLAAEPGGFVTRRKGAGMEPTDIREYVAGDDLRHLASGATARTGRLHIRQFSEERDRVTLLVADFRPNMLWGLKRAFRSVAAAEVLALIGWHVAESGGRVALMAITAEGTVVSPPRPRVRGMLDVIRGMVEAHRTAVAQLENGQAGDGPDFDRALVRAERLVSPGSEICIASGFDAPVTDLDDSLDALARRYELALYLVTAKLPGGVYPVRLQDGRRMRLRVSGEREASLSTISSVAGRDARVIDANETPAINAQALVGVAP